MKVYKGYRVWLNKLTGVWMVHTEKGYSVPGGTWLATVRRINEAIRYGNDLELN